MLKGSATSAGTAAYRAAQGARAAEGHFREWRGLSISSLGIGTYLGPDDDATDALYAAAVERAIGSGINVVDSAVNYRGQRSERAVGRALGRLVGAGRVAREALLVATKGGFLPFDGPAPPGLLRPGDLVAGCHCVTPRYLEDQIERSRVNLGLETIDIYYLHNPETQLGEVSRPAFMRRLRAAFELLESAARDRRIALYGTSTWSGYRQPQTARDFLSLPDLVTLAKEVGGPEHRFRVVQLPYNLAMPEAFTLPNQGAGRAVVPLLEAARQEPPAGDRAVPAGPRHRRPAGAAVRALHARSGHGARRHEDGRPRRRGRATGRGVAGALGGIPEALRAGVSGLGPRENP